MLELEEFVTAVDSDAEAVAVPATVVLLVPESGVTDVSGAVVSVVDTPAATCIVVLPGPLSYDVTLPTLASLLTLPVT